DASSVVMCSGAAIARPPSCLNRCASARYVGRARMLSPTQFSPMTTVSLGIVRLAFARRVPLPAIVHPQPQLGTRCDAPRDDVIDSRRQRDRIALGLTQFVRPYCIFKLDPMPEPVGYAKTEHNRRRVTQSHLRGCRSRPCGTAEEGDEDAFARLD